MLTASGIDLPADRLAGLEFSSKHDVPPRLGWIGQFDGKIPRSVALTEDHLNDEALILFEPSIEG